MVGVSLLAVTMAAALAAAQATTSCETQTDTQLAIAGTTITDYDTWRTSMDAIYSTPGVSFSGSTVFVATSVLTYPGGSFTGYYTYDSNALSSAGYSFTTETLTSSECSTVGGDGSSTATATGTCQPHGDHWHCPSGVPEPTYLPSEVPQSSDSVSVTPSDSTAGGGLATATTAETCEPHGDHWHCPPGVPEPTSLPGDEPQSSNSVDHTPIASTVSDSSITTTAIETCEPHGDHWHCPSGVPEPTFLPGDAPESSNSVVVTVSGSANSSSASLSTTTAPPAATAGALRVSAAGASAGAILLAVAGFVVL